MFSGQWAYPVRAWCEFSCIYESEFSTEFLKGSFPWPLSANRAHERHGKSVPGLAELTTRNPSICVPRWTCGFTWAAGSAGNWGGQGCLLTGRCGDGSVLGGRGWVPSTAMDPDGKGCDGPACEQQTWRGRGRKRPGVALSKGQKVTCAGGPQGRPKKWCLPAPTPQPGFLKGQSQEGVTLQAVETRKRDVWTKTQV